MAVPSSGTLNQLGLAQECLNGTYGSGSISGRICLETLVTSGQCGSQSETYPAINTASASHPNTSTPHEFSEFYGYDKDAVSAILRFRTCSTYGKGAFACFPVTIGVPANPYIPLPKGVVKAELVYAFLVTAKAPDVYTPQPAL